jgi:hypothetical protein
MSLTWKSEKGRERGGGEENKTGGWGEEEEKSRVGEVRR